jgi:RNA polymerase sigma-70 factor (ECF subfamily)
VRAETPDERAYENCERATAQHDLPYAERGRAAERDRAVGEIVALLTGRQAVPATRKAAPTAAESSRAPHSCSNSLGISAQYPGNPMRLVQVLGFMPLDTALEKPLPAAQVKTRPVMDAEDARLLDACRLGDRRAMEALYHRFKRRVFSLVARIAGVGDAEEVSQEVFVRIFRGLARFRGDSQLSTWIYRLAVNAALSHVERRPRRAEGEDALAHVAAEDKPATDPYLVARLEQALAALPAGYRAVLVLHDVEGLSHEEIGEILDCRVGTSKSQLHKARAKMRELLALPQGDRPQGAA